MIEQEKFIRYCEERMAYYMVPRYIKIKQKFPKTATERVEEFRFNG
jgi:crotonobetaine/carnitine-CoA ligase